VTLVSAKVKPYVLRLKLPLPCKFYRLNSVSSA